MLRKIKRDKQIFILLSLYLLSASVLFSAQIYAFAAVVLALYYYRREMLRLPRVFWIFMISGIIIRGITTIASLDPGLSFRKSEEMFIFMTFIPAFILSARGYTKRLAEYFIYGLLIIIFYTFVMHLIKSGFQFDLKHRLTVPGGYMTFGTLGAAGVILSLGLCLRQRWFIIPALVCLLALALSFTRSGWIGAGAGIFLFLLLRSRKLLIPLAVIGIIVFLLLPSGIRDRGLSIFSGGGKTGSLRVEMWKWGMKHFKDNPITGIGPNMVKTLRNSQPAGLSAQARRDMVHLHSVPVHLLTTMGILGGIFFLIYLLFMLYFPIKGYLRNGDDLSAGLLSFCVAALLIGIFEYNIFDAEVSMFLGVILGLSAGYGADAVEKEA